MDDLEQEHQERLHKVIEEILLESGDIKEGQILTGWVVCYEAMHISEASGGFAGSFYGPREMSTWRALGLIEWVRRFSLRPDDDDEDDGDD